MDNFSTLTLPIFQSGQVLRHSDLNILAEYLDQQDRLTRMLLVGIGIVEGLIPDIEVDSSNRPTKVTVGNGIGISSDGYMFYLNQDIELTRYYESTVPQNDVICAPPGSGNPNLPVFELLEANQFPDLPTSNGTPPPPVQDLPVLPAGEYIAIVYLKDLSSKDSRCFSKTETQTSGRKYEIRVFLIDKSIYTLCPTNAAPSTPTQAPAFGNFVQPYIRRFGYNEAVENGVTTKKIDLSRIQSFDLFFQNYVDVCSRSFVIIREAYVNAYETYRNVLSLPPTNPFTNLDADLQALLDLFNQAAQGSIERIGIQYLYDYLHDLIAAHNEFVDSAVDLRLGGQLLPDTCLHPRHLVLGNLTVNSGGTVVDTSKCRSVFHSSAFHEENTGKNRKALFLLQRMIELVRIAFPVAGNTNQNQQSSTRPVSMSGPVGSAGVSRLTSLTSALNNAPIVHLPVPSYPPGLLITPGFAYSSLLSARSVPYYLDPSIKTKWNFFLHETGREATILGYHFRNAQAPYDEPFLYKMEEYQFFRVEGHLRMPVSGQNGAYETLRRLQQNLDLPFDIQFVKLGNLIGTTGAQELMPGDLQPVYEAVSLDIWCMLKSLAAPPSLKATILPASLVDFSYTNFESRYKSYTGAPSTGFDQIDCHKPLLLSLETEYQLRRQRFHLFHLFAGQHQGLEHLGGVPKGGTLVVVYADLPDPVVVGDFALPYSCCADRGGAVFPDTYVAVPPGYFCQNDEQDYELITYPSGGVLTWQARTPAASGGTTPVISTVDYISSDPSSGKFNLHPELVPAAAFVKGKAVIDLMYIRNAKQSTGAITIYETPSFDISVKGQPVKNIVNGRLVSQEVTFEAINILPADADPAMTWKWIVAGEPAPVRISPTEIRVVFPYTEGLVYNVKLIAANGICRTKRELEFKLCEDEATLQLLSPEEFPQGTADPVRVHATPAGGVFQLIDPDMHVIRPVAIPETGQQDVYQLPADSMQKIGTYQLIYSLQQCLQEAGAILTVTNPPIEIIKSRFCSDDDTNYPIQLNLTGGTFDSNAPEIIEQNGQFFFNPSLLTLQQFSNVGLAEVNLTYTVPGTPPTIFTRQLQIFLVPEIEAITRRPIYDSVEVRRQVTCLLAGYNIQFRVKPDIWDQYTWEIVGIPGQKTGSLVDFDFRFVQGNEFRLKVVASSNTVLSGGCPPEKVEIVQILCPQVKVDLDLVKAAQDQIIVLPPPNRTIPTFLIGSTPALRIKVNQLGGVFKTEMQDITAIIPNSFIPAPASLTVMTNNAVPCRNENIEYSLSFADTTLPAVRYRLSYWIEDCSDEIIDTVDFFLQQMPVVTPVLTPAVTPAITPAVTPVLTPVLTPAITPEIVTPPVEPAPEPLVPRAAIPDLLGNRLKEYRDVMDALGQDNNVPRSNAFKFAQELLATGNELPTLNDNFEKAVDAVAKKVKETTNEAIKANYELLADTVIRYYLDRLIAFSPLGVPESAAELLSKNVTELKDALNFKDVIANWQGAELKEKLGATAADALVEILKKDA